MKHISASLLNAEDIERVRDANIIEETVAAARLMYRKHPGIAIAPTGNVVVTGYKRYRTEDPAKPVWLNAWILVGTNKDSPLKATGFVKRLRLQSLVHALDLAEAGLRVWSLKSGESIAIDLRDLDTVLDGVTFEFDGFYATSGGVYPTPPKLIPRVRRLLGLKP